MDRKLAMRTLAAVLCVVVQGGGPPAALAQGVEVRAEVDRTAIQLDDQVTLEVVVEGRWRGSQPEPPPLDDFEIYPRGTSQSMQFVNGRMSASTTYTYLLVPKREGRLAIGPFVLREGGSEHRTQPITITVSGGGGGAGGGEPGAPSGGPEAADPPPREERDIFVVARVDKQNVFVNEQVIYTFYLYRAERAAQITNVSYGAPSFQGFWVEKLADSERQSYKMLNGRRYIVTELSTAIFPTTSGRLEIDAATLQLVVLTNPFGFSLFDRGTERVLRTRPVWVEVATLPVAGKPASFEGAVGEALALAATLDRTEVQEGEPVTLTVRVEGTGNVKTFSKPRLPALPQFKIYDSSSKTDVQASDRVSGSRTFEIVLVPTDEGEHEIPPLQLAYFDTREGRYRTLETKPLHVTAVRGAQATVSQAAPAPRQQDIQILGRDIAHIRTDVPLGDTTTPLYRRPLVLAVLPLPFLAALGVTLRQRRRVRLASDVALARSVRARKVASKHLAAARKSLADGREVDFYGDVARALLQFVGDKLNVSALGLTRDELRERVAGAGVPAATAAALVTMLDRCDAARFAPSMGGEGRRDLLREAESLLVALDEGWRRRQRRAAPLATLVAAAVLGLGLAAGWAPLRAQVAAVEPPPRAADFVPPGTLLERAHAAYESGDFAAAIAAYRAAERQGVRNGPLYYDLGNAYFKNGELGRAIASYRRAELLLPRDLQVRANLEFALQRREDKAVTPRDVPFVGWIRHGFRWLSLNEWVAVTLALYAWVAALWIVRVLLPRRPAAVRWALLASGGLLALATVTTALKVRAVRGVPRGVVTVSRVEVTSGPGEGYTAEFSLHEGADVRIESARAQWVRISIGEKLRGWIPAASLERI